VAPQRPANVKVLSQAVENEATSLPLLVVELARGYLEQIDHLSERIDALETMVVYEGRARNNNAPPANRALSPRCVIERAEPRQGSSSTINVR